MDFSWKLKNIDHNMLLKDRRLSLMGGGSHPWRQVCGVQALGDTSLRLLKEGKSSAHSAAFSPGVSPPPEKDGKSDQKPAEAELEITQRVNGEDQHEGFGQLHPGLAELAGGRQRGVAAGATRRRMGKVGLSAARSGVSILLGVHVARMGSSYATHAVSRHVCQRASNCCNADQAGSHGSQVRGDRSVSSGDPVLSLAHLYTGPLHSGKSLAFTSLMSRVFTSLWIHVFLRNLFARRGRSRSVSALV